MLRMLYPIKKKYIQVLREVLIKGGKWQKENCDNEPPTECH